MQNIIFSFWQILQNILGIIFVSVFAIRKKITGQENYLYIHKDVTVYWIESKKFSGISLGNTIIINNIIKGINGIREKVIKHEYGHCRQSKMLGPLYLPTVGIVSLSMNILTRIGVLKKENYYKRWPEKWADKLGGVNRRK